MAIIKQARNIKHEVKKHYQLQVKGEVQKVANTVNIEAMHRNLVLASNKKVVYQGGK